MLSIDFLLGGLVDFCPGWDCVEASLCVNSTAHNSNTPQENGWTVTGSEVGAAAPSCQVKL